MRPLVPALDVSAMDWAPLGPAGLYSKLLSLDADSGARTALQRMVPADGYRAPAVAHFHETYEELLGVQGCFSFDGRHWVRPRSYLFHAPRTVHGFKSTVNEESWFLSRVGRSLDFNFVEQPAAQEMYCVDAQPPRRPAKVVLEPLADVEAQHLEWPGVLQYVSVYELGRDPASREGSALLQFASGATLTLPPGWQPDYLEWFVLEGVVDVDGTSMSRHWYAFRPGETRPTRFITGSSGALLYVNVGAPGLPLRMLGD